MSFDVQVDPLGITIATTVLISEIIPTNETNEYYRSVTNAVYTTTTVLTVSLPSGGTNLYAGRLVLVLDGTERSKCYTIISNTTTSATVYEDASAINGSHIAIVHTATTMRAYCIANNKDCISVVCESITGADGSPESPSSYADHTTFKVGTGKYKQGVSMNKCNIWYSDERDRVWKFNQIRGLMYHWHKVVNNQPVYLIITIEHLTASGNTYRSNIGFFYKYSGDANVDDRGYLKGFTMEIPYIYKFSPEFKLSFKEAWTL